LVENENGREQTNSGDGLQRLILVFSKLKGCTQQAYRYRKEQTAKGWTQLLRVIVSDFILLLSLPIRLLSWAVSTTAHVIAVLTLIYVLFAGAQWWTMRGQLGEMKSSSGQTDETIRALKEQANTMDAQLATIKSFQRAFVTIRDPIMESSYNPGTSPHHVLEFVWENSGNTPTRNLTVRIACIPADGADPAQFRFDDPKLTGSFLLPPKGVVVQGDCPITYDEMVVYAHRTKNLTIIARATYGDISDPTPTHITEYCAMLHGLVGNPVEGMAPGQQRAIRNTSMEVCRTHNCADEECKDWKPPPHDTSSIPKATP
jgi:hypothetical protein